MVEAVGRVELMFILCWYWRQGTVSSWITPVNSARSLISFCRKCIARSTRCSRKRQVSKVKP